MVPFTEYSPLSLVEQSPYLNQTLIEHPGSRVVAIEASEHLESYRQDPRYHTLRSYVDVGAAARLATPTEVFDTIEVVIHFESSQGADIGRLDEALDGPRAQLNEFSQSLVRSVEQQTRSSVICMLGATAGGQVLAVVK